MCGSNPEVLAITFQQPGRVLISGTQALLQGIPSSLKGTDALTGKPITLSPGHNLQNVVSFVSDPKSQGGALRAVCVEDTTPAQARSQRLIEFCHDSPHHVEEHHIFLYST